MTYPTETEPSSLVLVGSTRETAVRRQVKKYKVAQISKLI